ERRDSQGLCFLGGVSIEDALVRELQPAAGDVVDRSGNSIGTHRGAALYTMGQRHGFEVHSSSASAEPLFIVGKDVGNNTITVAPRENKDAANFVKIHLREENWIGKVASGAYQARFRYRQKLFPATLSQVGGKIIAEIKTIEPIPPGQSLVLYKRVRCVGGGIIAQVDSVQ
ncbi:MAG: tRNA methyl transferase PRC-barrel domain-containing protein, partial [Minisyncoccia bacterium]